MPDKPEHIAGAKLVDRVWVDSETGQPLTNAQLQKLRRAAERAQRKVEREQAKADKADT